MKILISTGENPKNYASALESFGVQAVGGYLPEPDGECDGLILCGGNDIEPGIYGEKNKGSVQIDSRRDERELELLRLYSGRPILGICRGCQMMNAFFGGKLDQDIASKAFHAGKGSDLFHTVSAAPGSILSRLYGENFSVNSSHHQAVSVPAPGFRVTLRSADGIIEAIEHETMPMFAVQWHPERTMLGYYSERAVDGARIFEEFLRLCK